MGRSIWITLVPACAFWLLFAPVAGQKRQASAETPANPDAKAGAVQAGQAKQVEFLTVDRVKLKGRYYPGDRDKSPPVLLLHAIGDTSGTKEWTNLAKLLHEKGYAVLMFDFRGHGESTTVMPGTPMKTNQPGERGFWDEMVNAQYVKGYAVNKPRPTEIKHEQFSPLYWTVLVNDIAAAKAFLDEQADCNSSNLILIGANDGATLGALWLNSEFHRFRYVPAAPGQPESLDRQNPEGQAVRAAIWLTIKNTFGTSKSPLNLAGMLDVPARVNKVPMIFAYGEGDSTAAGLTKKVFDKLVPAKSKKDYPNTEILKVVGAEQMSGKMLLLDSLETSSKIVKYLEDVPESKAAGKARKAMDESYFWLDPSRGLQPVIARKKGADRVEFATYSNFLK